MLVVNNRIQSDQDFLDDVKPELRLHTLKYETQHPIVIDLVREGSIHASFYFTQAEIIDLIHTYLKLSLQK